MKARSTTLRVSNDSDKLEFNCQSFVLLVNAENDECSLDDGDDDRKTRQYESMLPREMK